MRPPPGAPPGLPAPAAIESRCCRLDRTTGHFGPEKGVNARYSGDVLLLKNGDRIHFPHDLISDTKELYQFARSSNKALYQERRMRIIGEVRSIVSVEIEEQGETGATTPFFHSKCAAFDTGKKRSLRIEDIAPKQAKELLDEGRRRFEATAGHEKYRFVPTSFALIGSSIRFCGTFRDDQKPAPRLDVEVPWAPP